MYLSRYAIALLRLTHHVTSEEHRERGGGGIIGCENCVRLRGAVTEHSTDEGKRNRDPKERTSRRISGNRTNQQLAEEDVPSMKPVSGEYDYSDEEEESDSRSQSRASSHEASDAEDERQLAELEMNRPTSSAFASNATWSQGR